MSKTEDKVINITLGKIRYRLTRLNDEKYYQLWEDSLPIADDYGFYMDLYLNSIQNGEQLNLAQVYVTIERLCGKSGRFFDDWKGSFSFPFLVEVIREESQFDYLLHIYDHRGSLYFGFRKILLSVANYDPIEKSVIRQPFTEELSREEINQLISYIYGYLMGYFESTSSFYNQFFLKRVDSNLILYGYKDGEFFEEQYETQEAYEEATKSLADSNS